MDLKVYSFNTTTFCAKRVPIKEMQRLLLPMIKEQKTLKEMSTTTGISMERIKSWVEGFFGQSLAKVYKKNKRTELVKISRELIKNGQSIDEIAKNNGIGAHQLKELLKDANILRSRKQIYRTLEEKVPDMLKSGMSLKAISKELKINDKVIRKWLQDNYNAGIVQIRNNNILTSSQILNKTQIDLKSKIQALLEEGKTVTETAQILGKKTTTLFYWIKKFNLIPNKNTAIENAKTDLAKMLEDGLNIRQMAEKCGVSKTTIERLIIDQYGKKYSFVKAENNI